ncbi:unnamed protein product, partial [Polarella glacialis]
MDRSGASGAAAENGAAWSSYNGNGVANGNGVQKAENSVVSANGNGVAHTNVVANGCPQAALADLEKKVADIHQDFSQSLHKVGEKENEKFDLIFAILTELQHRQAQLEESVRSLKAQFGGQATPQGHTNMVMQQQGNGCGFNG